MALNFLETVKNYFTSEFSNQAANSLDESSAGVSKALSAIVPAGLAGILRKATSGNEGADSVFNMTKDAAGYLSPIPNLTDLHNDERGSEIPSSIFGSNQSQVESAVAHFGGIKNSSAAALITLALPAIMGFLGKHAAQNNLSASGLAGFLSSQKDNISQTMPAGLSSLAPLVGLGSLETAASSMSSTIKPDIADSTQTVVNKPRAKWLIPLIIIIAVILLLVYFSRGCNNTTPNNTVVTDTSTALK